MADESKKNKETPAWARLHLWQMQPIRDVLLALACLALFWMAQATSVVTVPLLLAILLAYLFEPVIRFAEARLKMSRQGAVVGIIVGMALIVIVPASLAISYGTVQAVSLSSKVYGAFGEVDGALGKARSITEARMLAQAADFAENQNQDTIEPNEGTTPSELAVAEDTPSTLSTGDDSADPVATVLGDTISADTTEPELVLTASDHVELAKIRDELENATGGKWAWGYEQILHHQILKDDESDVGGALSVINAYISSNSEDIAITGAGVALGTLERIFGFAITLFSLAFMGFITAFFFFFLATGWVQFQGFTEKLMPDKHRDRIIDLAVKFDAVISGFIRGRITIAFIQSIVFSIGYFLIGVPAAFILGPVVAILSIVPYLALVGLPVAIGLMILAEHSGMRGDWWWMIGAPTVFYFVGQALDDYVWTPMIQGKSTGLDTPVILFASMAGGALFGVFGLLIAIPLAACAKILIQEIFWPRFKDWAEGRSADPLPIDGA